MISFDKSLKIWFGQNKRELPWRRNKDPYRVWISEIILQQTRVEQGIPWYNRFMERFPDIGTLASASEKEVLIIWQGLGYYSRARNLHFAAKQIIHDYQGSFPGSYEEIRKLKGIGNYTASAVASISFGLPHAVIDGNVYRVLSRVFGIITPVDTAAGKKEFAALANMLLDRKDPGNFNEALMDFGALQCKPQQPLCEGCPFEESCEAKKNNQIHLLPVKSKRILVRKRYFTFLFIHFQTTFYLQKRTDQDIWKNLYQFPLIETTADCSDKEITLSEEFITLFKETSPVIEWISPAMIHLLSHQKLQIRFIKIHLDQKLQTKDLIAVSIENLSSYPLPKPINNFLEKEFKKGV